MDKVGIADDKDRALLMLKYSLNLPSTFLIFSSILNLFPLL